MAELQLQIEELPKPEERATGKSMELDSSSGDICKICHCGSEESGGMPLITPCLCAGSIKFVHQGTIL